MKPREQVAEDLVALSTEGLQVEEARDEDTIRRFMREWRQRAARLPSRVQWVDPDGRRARPASH